MAKKLSNDLEEKSKIPVDALEKKKARLLNNLGWKILSVLLAFLLWMAVINIEDPQVTTTIRGITVEKRNEDAITSRKQAIQYVTGDTVDVKVKGKRSVIYRLTQSSIQAYANMKNLSITGAVDIELELPNEVELVSKSPSSVSVQLENIIVKQIGVEYQKTGKVKDGFVDLSPTITPNVISLEAAESVIYKIEKVVVPVDIENISGDFTISVTPLIYDYSGAEVTNVSMSVQQVQVKVPVEKTKTVPLFFEPMDEVGENYKYMGATLSDSGVVIRGKAAYIDSLQELIINNVSIARMTEKQTVTVNLAKLLPDGVSLNQDRSTVDVEINIEPIITQVFEFAPDEIEIRELPENKELLVISQEPLQVEYKGVESIIKALKKEDLQPFVNVGELNNGTHSLLINWNDLVEAERISEEESLTVEISERTAAEEADATGTEGAGTERTNTN